MMANQDEKAQIRAQLETLARQVSDDWRQHLRSLRTALDLQISSIEGAFDDTDNSATIDAAVKRVSDAVAESAQHARKQAEATAAKALAAIEVELRARLSTETAANIMLRSALDEAKKEQKKLTTAIDTAQAKMLTMQTQLKTAQREAEANSMALAAAQQQVQALTSERADLLQQVKTVTAAKAAADAQWRQLEGVSQKLSSALSQMVREREPGGASVDEALARAVPAPAPAAAKPAPLKAVRAASAPASPRHRPLRRPRRKSHCSFRTRRAMPSASGSGAASTWSSTPSPASWWTCRSAAPRPCSGRRSSRTSWCGWWCQPRPDSSSARGASSG